LNSKDVKLSALPKGEEMLYITDLNCKIIINIYKILRFIIDYIFTIKRCVLYYSIIYVCILVTATIQLYISFQRNLGDLSRGQNLRL